VAAKRELVQTYGFKDYGSKHHESRFTKFYQEVYLPQRYGFDKRRLHLSSQIVAGQLTRPEALKELEKPLNDADSMRRELSFIAKKLGISVEELRQLMAAPHVPHEAYPGGRRLIGAGTRAKALLRRLAVRRAR
ncbi:MAG: N-acetyl sugar amidotransferase, partial [Polyangiaceae bacterium]